MLYFLFFFILDHFVLQSIHRKKKTHSEPKFLTFKGPKNRFQDSARLCSLAGRYDNPLTTRFLDIIDCLKIPAQCPSHVPLAPRETLLHQKPSRWRWNGTASLISVRRFRYKICFASKRNEVKRYIQAFRLFNWIMRFNFFASNRYFRIKCFASSKIEIKCHFFVCFVRFNNYSFRFILTLFLFQAR